ncbi:MAG: hypothetical protein NXI32_17600 [bacterium]|nr:hypothetical protein [bacterium]
MAKQTIIDWDTSGLLLAVVGGKAASASIQAMSWQPLADASNAATSPAQAMAKGVAELGLGKGEVTVIAPRSFVEMRTLRIPRIEPDELPDVIRFQAQRQLANMGDSWTLDYILLPDEGQEMLTALVGAVAPNKLADMETACQACNLELTHVAVRPLEVARQALLSSGQPTGGGSLIICKSGDAVDFVLTKDGHVILVRNTKVPGDAEKVGPLVIGELRRSLMAASSSLPNFEVDRVLLLSSEQFREQIEGQLQSVLTVPTTHLNVADWLPKGLEDREQVADEQAHRIAALCGATSLPSAEKNSVIDFKQPKRRPPKKKNTLRYALAGAAAVLVALSGVSWWINANRSLDGELELLNAEIASKQELVTMAREKIAVVNEIDQFAKSSPNFLDELTYMAEKIPDSTKVILAGPTFSTLSDGTGQIRVNIAADSFYSISEFEDSLRDDDHIVMAREPQESAQPTELYKVEATETIRILNRGWQLVSKLSTSSRDTTSTAEASSKQEESGESPDQNVESEAMEPVEQPGEGGSDSEQNKAEGELNSDDADVRKTAASTAEVEESGPGATERADNRLLPLPDKV